MKNRAGQAAVELMAAIIGVLVVVAGLLQLALMIGADTRTLQDASAAAANRAGSGLSLSDSPDIVAGWEDGEDGLSMTKDDEMQGGSLGGVRREISSRAVPRSDWSALEGARHRAIADFNNNDAKGALGLVKGSASEEVEVIPAARMLLMGGGDTRKVENETWMTATGGIY